MENQRLNQTEQRIEKGIAGLRGSEMPNPPDGLVEKMIANEGPRNRSAVRAAVIFATMGAGAAMLFALMPRSATAAESLDRLVDAHQRSAPLVRVTSYWIEGGERTPKMWHGYVMGERWRYVQPDFEQASDRVRLYSYYPVENRAQTCLLTAKPFDLRSVMGDTDLSWWNAPERKRVALEHNVLWEGSRVDRYTVATYSKDWGVTRSILYADPVANRPLYAENVHESGNGNAMKWEYLDPADEGLLQIKMKIGAKVEDVTAITEKMRRAKNGQVEEPAKAQASGG